MIAQNNWRIQTQISPHDFLDADFFFSTWTKIHPLARNSNSPHTETDRQTDNTHAS